MKKTLLKIVLLPAYFVVFFAAILLHSSIARALNCPIAIWPLFCDGIVSTTYDLNGCVKYTCVPKPTDPNLPSTDQCPAPPREKQCNYGYKRIPITDDKGCIIGYGCEKDKTIPPPGQSEPPKTYIRAYIQVKSQNIKAGNPVIFELIVQPPNAVHREVTWNFGDGNTKYFGGGVAGSRNVWHAYTSPGDYTVSVNFVEWDGTSVPISPVKVTVSPAAAPEKIIDQQCKKYYTNHAKEYDLNKDGKLDNSEFLTAFRDRKNLTYYYGYLRPKFSVLTLKKMMMMMRLGCSV